MEVLYVELERTAEDRLSAVREIGLDASGRVVHRSPSKAHRFGAHGMLDPRDISFPLADAESDLSAMEFEGLWMTPDLLPPPNLLRAEPNLLRRIYRSVFQDTGGPVVRVRESSTRESSTPADDLKA